MNHLRYCESNVRAGCGNHFAENRSRECVRRVVLLLFAVALMAAISCSAPDKPAGPETVTTASGVATVRIPAGTFAMGDPSGEIDAEFVRQVTVNAFYMDVYEVTQGEYERVMGDNPSRWTDPDAPVEQVRWSDAVRYCNARSELEGLTVAYDTGTWTCDFTANGYRLPTEAEWEYAARGGTTSTFFFGPDDGKMDLYAWTKSNAGRRTHPVGKKLPNAWGLYDMYGNVWEWCHDLYAPDGYETSGIDNPTGPAEGDTRIVRGGSWDTAPAKCSSTFRYSENPGYADVCFGYDVYGFRPVRNAEE
jgi:formylglycine-generating enzyme required for sulfatase activity